MKNLKNFWCKIKRRTQMVGNFQAHLILTMLYLLLVVPTGIITKLGGDLLEIRYSDKTQSYWKFRPTKDDNLRAARCQG